MSKIELPHNFIPRPYQEPLYDYMTKPTAMTKEYGDRRAGKRATMVWHRRTGKDKTCLADHVFPAMFERVGAYHYYFPTAADGRAILWDGMDKDGFPFMKHLPDKLIARKDQQQMKIITVNGSIFQIIGTDRTERVGTNPVGSVFSEFSKQNPKWWDLVRPILAENGGWAIFNQTPRGKNHAYRLFRMAQTNPDWFSELLTVDDTHAISLKAIDAERKAGMTEALIQREFYCSWDMGVEAAFYAKVMSSLYKQGRITNELSYNDSLPVYSVCDPGFHWPWGLFQIRSGEPVFIRAWQEIGMGVEDHAQALKDLQKEYGYRYAKHFAPIDTEKNNAYKAVAGKSLKDHALENGLEFTILPLEHRVYDGIERTRQFLFTCWFIKADCEILLDALETYQSAEIKTVSTETQPVYTGMPADTWANHMADMVRYASMAVKKGLAFGSATKNRDRWRQLKAEHGN